MEASKESYKVHTNRCQTCRDQVEKQKKNTVKRKYKKSKQHSCDCGFMFRGGSKEASMERIYLSSKHGTRADLLEQNQS